MVGPSGCRTTSMGFIISDTLFMFGNNADLTGKILTAKDVYKLRRKLWKDDNMRNFKEITDYIMFRTWSTMLTIHSTYLLVYIPVSLLWHYWATPVNYLTHVQLETCHTVAFCDMGTCTYSEKYLHALVFSNILNFHRHHHLSVKETMENKTQSVNYQSKCFGKNLSCY